MYRSFFKFSLKTFFSDPLFYVSGCFNLILSGFFFFFLNKFFVIDMGTTDLGMYFSGLVFSFTLTVPVIVFRQKFLFFEDSFPITFFSKNLILALSVFTAAFIPVCFSFSIPVCANLFGNVDFSGAIAGFIGIVFLIFLSIAVVFAVFAQNPSRTPIFSFFISVLILGFLSFIHILPGFFSFSDFINKLIQKISLIEHFSPFARGIIDSREICFFVLSFFSMILLSTAFQYRSSEKKIPVPALFFFCIFFIFSFLWSSRVYFHVDMSSSKKYSLTSSTTRLLKKITSPLKITYYKSPEIYDFYPSCRDIPLLLKEYALTQKNVFFTEEKADGKKLEAMGAFSSQVKKEGNSKIEFVSLYSAILIQYRGENSLVPLILSSETVEFDVTMRISGLISANQKKVYVALGNGFSLENDYSLLLPWLKSRGIQTEVIELNILQDFLDGLSPQEISNSALFLLGSSLLTEVQCSSIKNAVEKGFPLFVLTSPYSVDLYSTWNVSKTKNDRLIPILEDYGFVFEKALAEDISSAFISMETADELTGKKKYTSQKYPLWIRVLPQKNAPVGATVFWASPVACYGKVEPLFFSTEHGWKQAEDDSGESVFINNPFLVPKNPDSAKDYSSLVLAADLIDGKRKITLIPDQYFVHTVLTGYISAQENADFRNYDWVASRLYRLLGQEEMALLMEKNMVSKKLEKIPRGKEFDEKRKSVLMFVFVVQPLIFIAGAGCVFFVRKRKYIRR